jgi:lipopolysaccharide biosynthesis protein
MKNKEKALRRLSTDLSKAKEEVELVKRSKSFIVGYYLLHPWRLPGAVSKKIWHSSKRTTLLVLNSRSLYRSTKQYQKINSIVTTHERSSQTKVAVVLHLYYTDLWEYFSDKLKTLSPLKFDLFVSAPKGKEKVVKAILADYPDACVIFVPNRGRDVLPFLKIMSALSDKGYQYVLKVHSKKSKHRKDGSIWFKNIVESLIPKNPDLVKELLKKLEEKSTGLIGPEGQYVSLLVNYEANKRHIRRLITSLMDEEIREKVDSKRYDYGFFAGTMFWARLDAIKDLIDQNYSEKSFEIERGQIDNTFAHAIERVLCLLPELKGRKIYSISKSQINEVAHDSGLIPEWSDIYPD